ncbi:chaperone protein dnaJ 72 isoform X1 [Malania oleifera]|uniref:chaperone protein dnaJ 72 isoform X1 n=1 Tax=Malania oleifera TaxID=397392 RepID=UPI0025AE1D45|nr:chaperone protein dnaJ 72 isoform X1 [Malania oleifera]
MDGDHYKVLGLRRDASKEEIKQAFWKLAMQFHPDKHSHSPNSVKDDATRQFKRLSEAYDVLSDDRKRADYNLRSASATHGGYGYYNRGNSYGRYNGASRGGSAGGYRHHNDGNSYGHFSGARRGGSAGGYGASSASDWGAWMNKFKGSLRFPTRHTVVINVAIASGLVSGAVIFDMSRETLWKMHNSGKSFEETMESIEKAKTQRGRKL